MLAMSPGDLESLLFEEESATLDFKRDQYPFDNETDEGKSELLKDILAFANAWRRSDAYILIGVEEVQGGRSKVIGVANHIDDAKLQQFVNSKTHRPLYFSYFARKLDGLDVGVIHIPPQERPIYLTKKYGKLEKNTVYIRRSSSTDIASPEEIARMGQAAFGEGGAVPLLDVQFFDHEELVPLGHTFEFETGNLVVPDDQKIPDYGVSHYSVGGNLSLSLPIVGRNRDYFREAARYLKTSMETSRTEFVVSNSGSVVAQDVRLEITIDDPSGNVIVRDETSIPAEPSPNYLSLDSVPNVRMWEPDITVQRSRQTWIIRAELGKIQPKGSANTSSGLYIGSKTPLELQATVKVFADNLPAPRTCVLSIRVEPQPISLSVDQTIETIRRLYLGEDS